MSIITWPDFGVANFSWGRQEQSVPFKSAFGSQALVVGSPLWVVEMSGPGMRWAQARLVEQFIESLAGHQNQLALWNLVAPVPAGTMRGSLSLVGSHLQGVTSLSLTGGSGQALKTLLAGDLLGLGSGLTQQVVKVTADAVADGDGDITVQVAPSIRNAFPDGTEVVWNKPCALFRQSELARPTRYEPGRASPWALTLIEDWKV